MHEIDLARHSPLLDPALHVWGWEIPVYLFLGGLAAGTMIVGSLLAARAGPRSAAARWLLFAPAALLSLGMLALFLDLSRKAHVWRFYLAFRATSPMSWGAWILLAVYPVSLLAALAGLEDGEASRVEALLARARLGGVARAARALAVDRAACLRRANTALGIGLGVYTGVLLSTLGARALWASALLGPLFLVSGASTGAAFLLLFRLAEDERHAVERWDRLAMGVELALLALFLVGLSTAGEGSRQAAALLLGGRFTAQFWTLVVLGGLLAPLLLGALQGRLALRATAVAPVLVLAGGFALRWILVAAGQA
ncbi:NrfD/PsrC family molybdoenzyme membrane anchor subunit [Anaeromyxobacter diazotrophicus]|nr:NrfD/PsrC family molybdoenzyme membrane anchor subunit [Anaeromyxobacter diazotrophicus]